LEYVPCEEHRELVSSCESSATIVSHVTVVKPTIDYIFFKKASIILSKRSLLFNTALVDQNKKISFKIKTR